MNVKDRLQGVFRKVFDDDSIELYDAMTAADLDDWDSLSHVQLMVAVEKDFGIRFLTAEVISLKDVGEMIRLLEDKVKG
jgi:acyl carrier protein